MNEGNSLKGTDIVILSKFIDNNMLVENIERKVTGGNFPYDDLNSYNHKLSIERLVENKLIRKNTPQEFIEHFNIIDLQDLLKTNGVYSRSNNNKSSLKKLTIKNISDEKIIAHEKYKEFYVITDDGKNMLQKYTNVVWFYKNKSYIFGVSSAPNTISENYFFKNYDKDPINLLLEYFRDKDYRIIGILYKLKNDFECSIVYAIKYCTTEFNLRMEKIHNDFNYYWNIVENLEYRIKWWNRDNMWINDVYKELFDSNICIENYIKKDYSKNFEYKDIVSYDLFNRIIQALIQNEQYDLKKYTSELQNIVSSSIEDVSQSEKEEDLEDYYDGFNSKNDEVLDFLINHLDLEGLKYLKERIEIQIENRYK